jgi:hypothetical protein
VAGARRFVHIHEKIVKDCSTSNRIKQSFIKKAGIYKKLLAFLIKIYIIMQDKFIRKEVQRNEEDHLQEGV